MTAFAAARLGDPVGHEFDWGGAGAAFGAALGGGLAQAAAAGVVTRGSIFAVGLGVVLGGPLGGAVAGFVSHKIGRAVMDEARAFGAWLGEKIGRSFATWLSETLGLSFDVTTGAIVIGDFTVWIELQPASRSCVDFAVCSYHPTPPQGIPPMIITGSDTVLIGKHPAARVTDSGACTFRILEGARHVLFGGEQETCECAKLWAKYRAEAEAIIAPHDHDHRARNRAINAAYAGLYLRDRRFIWAGLAAYASKQVGCAMDHAQMAMRAGDDLKAAGLETASGQAGSLGLGLAAYGAGADFAAEYTYEQLGKGNRELFLDVYPLHRFYEEHGAARMRECAGARTPPIEPEAMAAFEALDDESLSEQERRAESLEQLAIHEQINILQRQIYEDYMFRRILLANETGAPLTSPAKVSLGAGCDGKRTHKFSKGWMSDGKGGVPELYDEAERMNWILDEIAGEYKSFEGTQEHLDDLHEIEGQGP